jgi:DNA mismatch endonuclease, patch repair protein
MADVVDPKTRSRMMAGIRSKDTKPEMLLRRALHRTGFRYRLHASDLPGRPDIVFPARRAVIQVNGCFWHGHDCPLFKWPSSRVEFWQKKINRNKENDVKSEKALAQAGWRVLTVWECCLKGPARRPKEEVLSIVKKWLISGRKNLVLRGGVNGRSD